MRTIKLSVNEFLKGLVNGMEYKYVRSDLDGKTFDVFGDAANKLNFKGFSFIEQPSYDSLESSGTCMMWGGRIENATLLRNNMIKLEFRAVFVLSFKDYKFTVQKHVYSHVTRYNDATSGARPLNVRDYNLGFYHRMKWTGFPICLASDDLIRRFVDRCAERCFPKASVRLFREVIAEGCNDFVTINSILKPSYRTKADIITKGGNIKGLPKTLNKYNINIGFLFREAVNVLPRDSMARLYGRSSSEKLVEYLNLDNYHLMGFDSMKRYLLVALARYLYPSIDMNVVLMYFRVSIENGLKADISISNEHTMLRRMEGYYKEHADSPIHVAEPYVRLEKLLDFRYHLITTEEELYFEGSIQHNCVRTYQEEIESGRCGIFTMTEDGRRYTIEVDYLNGRYSCPQFFGFANSYTETCRRLEAEFKRKLDAINMKIAS